MIASQLLNLNLKPLTISVSVEEAECLFEQAQVYYLPVLSDESKVLGLICHDHILSLVNTHQHDLHAVMDEIIITPVLPSSCHYFEIIHVLHRSEADIVPVVDEHDKYVGCVSLHEIIDQSGSLLSVSYPGAIVVLETDIKDYNLSEIIRLIESNDIKVLGLETVEVPQTSKLHIHIKLNTGVLRALLASFERFGYDVYAHFMRQDTADDTEDRYRQLMNYLDLD
ncbi:MAG: CBS domain-containing protein [Bacteroidia bacterium]|nr:CBS domain-containing protein [Bacteroidota bacterium]MCZ2129843.1 CBS domain-containing protein [Bacteroidia bacterium]